jgi:primosomal protein N''
MERTMQFMLEHQARFDAKMDRIAVQHVALEEVVMKLAQSHVKLVESHQQLAESHQQLNQQLAASERRLAEAQVATSEKLEGFIAFVERYLSSRDDGEVPF